MDNQWNPSTYFRIRAAVESMATSADSLQSRLAHAVVHIRAIRVEDIPQKAQPEYLSIMETMTRIKNEERGHIFATAEQLTDEEAEGIARQVVNLLNSVGPEV